MQYFVDLVGSVAWPLCVFVLALLFRKQLAGVLGQLEHLKYKGLEARFRKQMDRIELKVRDAGLSGPAESETLIPGLPEEAASQIYRISDVSPRAAVSETWVMLEALISELTEQHDLSKQINAPSHTKLRALVDSGVIDESLVPILEELREVRNNVQHIPDFVVTPVEAQRYFFWAGALYHQLQQARRGSS